MSKQKNGGEAPKFGRTFTKHMVKMEYDADKGGWQTPQIVLLENLVLHPAAKVLHYANEVFEGMKAYKGDDGKLRLFRPEDNLTRLNRSCERAVLPQIDTKIVLKYLKMLVYLDQESLPNVKEGCFYIRPSVISTDADISIEAGRQALFFIILSPVGPYFGSGFPSIRVAAIDKFVRAWPGGNGEYKMGGNYAPIMYASNQVKKDNCQMVLWLFGEEQRLIEAGVMNLFVYYVNEQGEKALLTPPLDTTILPGITRSSILELTKEWNEFNVEEKSITLKEVKFLLKENRLLEVMGVGTACVVCPIAEILYEDEIIQLPTMEQEEPLFKRLHKCLTDIQFGRIQHPWGEIIESNILDE